jgi:hypothetical protein
MAAIALYAGSQRHVPPPFGPAVNGLIPYVVNGDIFVGDPVTGTTRLVVGGPGNDNTASFSPDGTQISFLRDMPTGEDIYVARADGSDVRKIISTPLGGLATFGWTPTSDGLLVGHDVNNVQRLEVLDAAATPRRALAEGLRAGSLSTSSADRRRSDLWTSTGLGPVRHGPTAPTSARSPRRSNKATRTGLTLRPSTGRGSTTTVHAEAETIQAWIMNADGSGQHRFNSSGPSCCWREGGLTPSPDGQSVAMWRRPVSEDGLITTGNGLITLYPADGSGDGRVIGPEFTPRPLCGTDSTFRSCQRASPTAVALVNPTTPCCHAALELPAEPHWLTGASAPRCRGSVSHPEPRLVSSASVARDGLAYRRLAEGHNPVTPPDPRRAPPSARMEAL